MAEEQHEVRRIHWNEVFSWTEIFRGFRLAIDYTKLGLAVAAITLVLLAGWVMDNVWSVAGARVYPNEIADHFRLPSSAFESNKETWQETRINQAAGLLYNIRLERPTLRSYLRLLQDKAPRSQYLLDAFREELSAANERISWSSPNRAEILQGADDYAELLEEAEEGFEEEIERIEGILPDAYERAEAAIDAADLDDDREEAARKTLERGRKLAYRALSERRQAFAASVREIRGETVGAALLEYESQCLWNAIRSVRYLNILGGLEDYRETLSRRAIQPVAAGPLQQVNLSPRPQDDRPGFVVSLLLAAHGFCWLIAEHWLYAIICLAVLLAVWAFFGGAIHRVAALHAAREERIGIGQALRFACQKFVSFFTAPLIIVAVVLFFGGLLALGGFALGNYAGGILMGILFFLALLVGFAGAFLAIGLVAGGGLMYPTIAVEGSDSFDAISRSFSYIFLRPFRAIWYGLVALVYGVVTYLFVRLFAFLALRLTHCFVKWGVFTGGERLDPSADKLDVLWATPQFDSLFGPFNWYAMSGWEKVGSSILHIWIYLVAAGVAAYLLTFFASSTTVIYLLLRKKVDATDLDDVYVEEPEEEIEAAPAEEAPEGSEGESASGESSEPEAQKPAEEGGEAEDDEEESQ